MATVFGGVADRNGEPVASATVTIATEDGVVVGVSNSSGVYMIGNVPEGNHQIDAGLAIESVTVVDPFTSGPTLEA